MVCSLALAVSLAGCAGLPDQRLANEALKRGDTATAAQNYRALADLGYSEAQVGLADIQVDSRFVSRHHCQVVTTPESSVIEDLNSTNGMTVRGKRVRRHVLADGDVVALGQHMLTYRDERVARES